MNMRMRVRTCAQSLVNYCSCVLNKIMPPKGGSERSELTPCIYITILAQSVISLVPRPFGGGEKRARYHRIFGIPGNLAPPFQIS